MHKEKVNTAKNMLKKNFDIKTISEVTNLSLDTIKKLKTEK